jgi:hypothetical protein
LGSQRRAADQPPWSAAPIDVIRERYCCPGCGGQVHGVFHRGNGGGASVGGHLLAPRGVGLTFAETSATGASAGYLRPQSGL